jgi:hypothetical protein
MATTRFKVYFGIVLIIVIVIIFYEINIRYYGKNNCDCWCSKTKGQDEWHWGTGSCENQAKCRRICEIGKFKYYMCYANGKK